MSGARRFIATTSPVRGITVFAGIVAILGGLFGAPAAASPFDGVWRVDYSGSCEPGDTRRICTEPAYFEIELWSRGKQLCEHFAFINGRVTDTDEPYPLRGTVSSNGAKLFFSSSFGAQGHARVTVSKTGLHWQILDTTPAEYTQFATTNLPRTETLRRSGLNRGEADCWKTLSYVKRPSGE